MRWLCLVAGAGIAAFVQAEPYLSGHSGLINMPDGRVAPEGTLGLGFSHSDPYIAGWASVTMFPWLESTVRFTRVKGVEGFPGNTSYGDYKDKSVGVKFRLLSESDWWPSLALGIDDFITDTPQGLFRTNYLAASKRVGEFDITVGAGDKHIDGLFAGLRYKPAGLPNWAFVAEYDATDYKNAFRADLTGVDKRKKAFNVGVEYRWAWLGVQLSLQQDHVGLNTYAQIPLQQRDWVPKLEEPAPYAKVLPRPTAAQWHDDPSHRRRAAEALHEQGFRNIRLRYENGELEAILTNSRISQVSRAVGRAVRVLMLLGPVDARQIKITYVVRDLPVATYTFFDLDKLSRYFAGMIPRRVFAEYVSIDYPNPGEIAAARDNSEALEGFLQEGGRVRVVTREEGDALMLKSEDSLLNTLSIRPVLSTYLNDPSGAFQYDLYASVAWNRRLGTATYAQVVARQTLAENLSDDANPSNSELPHVRSDVAEYKRGARFKIDRALVNHFFQPRERVYGRLSGGLYEEMYGGVGGQLLYLPRGARWALDFAADWVRQRDYSGFGFRDYSTLTALGSLNYKLPMQVTGTARVGRFLAKDYGVRFEVKRNFVSGVEVGAWYGIGDIDDVTSPGSPSSPYRDKGLFLSIPLNLMLPRDTQSVANFSISPWTRDVTQMVVSPGDLYRLLEKPMRDVHAWDGLVRFGDRDDDYATPDTSRSILDRTLAQDIVADAREAGSLLSAPRTWRAIGIGLGLTVVSGVLDNRVDKFVKEHGSASRWNQLDDAGKLVPVIALGGAGLAALNQTDPRLAETGVSALEAGLAGTALSVATKYLVGRSRPVAEQGHTDFHPAQSGDASFPSNHATAAWAALTPFAREYDMPWLYGFALLTSAGRIGTRQHWISDTVASGFLGYGIGSLIWSWHRDPKRDALRLDIGNQGVAVSRQF